MAKEARQFKMETASGKEVQVQQMRINGERWYTTNEGGVYETKQEIKEDPRFNKQLMKTEKSNVEKFYEWMQRINSIHLTNTPAMAAAFQKIVTHKKQ